jgi:predicted permease
VLAGLAPAFQGTKAGLAAVLKREERQVGGRWSLRNVLVTGQLAVSIVLLCAGFIFMRNLTETAGMNPGFDVDHAIWASMRLADTGGSGDRTHAVMETALARLRAVPGVDAAALMRSVPMNQEISVGAEVKAEGKQPVRAMWYQNDVSPDYFRAMGIPLVSGRDFERNDRDVVVLSENFARRVFGNTSPIGRTIESEPFGRFTVIGVAGNSSYMSFSDRNALAMYLPYGSAKLPGSHKAGELEFMVRAAGSTDSVLPAIRTSLGRIDPSAAVEARAMKNALTFALLPSEAGAVVLGAVGLLGLGLASVGLYGVLLYTVSRRIREIGLRVALGASPAVVLKLVLRHSLGLVGVGLGAGMVLAFLAVRPLAMFLVPNVRPTDPVNFVVGAAVLCVVALAATVAPAARALRVDPLTALRHE